MNNIEFGTCTQAETTEAQQQHSGLQVPSTTRYKQHVKIWKFWDGKFWYKIVIFDWFLEGQEPIGLAVLTDQELLMFKVDTDKIYRSSDFDYARIK